MRLAASSWGGLTFEAATLPRVSGLAGQNPATTSMIEARVREAQNNGEQPKRVQIWMRSKKYLRSFSEQSCPAKIPTLPRITVLIMKRFNVPTIRRRRKLRKRPSKKEKATLGCRTCLTSNAAPRLSRSNWQRTFTSRASVRSCARARKPSSLISWSAIFRRNAFWSSI